MVKDDDRIEDATEPVTVFKEQRSYFCLIVGVMLRKRSQPNLSFAFLRVACKHRPPHSVLRLLCSCEEQNVFLLKAGGHGKYFNVVK